MSADAISAIAIEHRHPISVEMYHQMIDTGVLSERDRVELIEGVIVAVSPQSPEHVFAVSELLRLLNRALGAEWTVRAQAPLTLARSEPEPDVAVVRRDALDAVPRHPTTAALVVEVARTSIALDRAMAETYAEAKVDEYWIIDTSRSRVEVYRDPVGNVYQSSRVVELDGTVRPALLPGVEVPVSVLFRARH